MKSYLPSFNHLSVGEFERFLEKKAEQLIHLFSHNSVCKTALRYMGVLNIYIYWKIRLHNISSMEYRKIFNVNLYWFIFIVLLPPTYDKYNLKSKARVAWNVLNIRTDLLQALSKQMESRP